MKKHYFLLFAFLFILSIVKAQWSYVGGPGISSPNNPWPALTLDNNGIPYVAYADQSNNNNPVVEKFIGGQWVNITDANLGSHVASSVAIAFDHQNNPYVAFIDDYQASYESVSVMTYNGGSWTLVGAGDFTDSLVSSTQSSLAIDNNGIIYVVYQNIYGGTVEVDKYNNGSWSKVGTNTPPVRWFSNISLDNTGAPYVAYTTGYSNVNYGYVQKLVSGSWVTLGGACFDCGGSTLEYPSVAIDHNNNPYVAYIDWEGFPSVKMFADTGWASVGQYAFGNTSSAYPSLAIDHNNTPYIAFEDNFEGQAAVMEYCAGSWAYVGGGDLSPGEATYTSIAISQTDTLYVAFNDYPGANQALSVMAHTGIPCATSTGIAETHDEILQIEPNPTTGAVKIMLPSNENGTIYLRDITGKVISQTAITGESETLHLDNLSAGMYLLTIQSEKGAITRKIVKE